MLPDRNFLAAVIVTLGTATLTLAQPQTIDPGKWRPVVYADLQVPGEFALPYASLWADELARNNDAYKTRGDKRWVVANAPATESHVVVRSPQRIITLSVLHTVTACKTLRVDAVGKATLKSCPMRLAIYQDGSSTVADAGRGCFVEYAAQRAAHRRTWSGTPLSPPTTSRPGRSAPASSSPARRHRSASFVSPSRSHDWSQMMTAPYDAESPGPSSRHCQLRRDGLARALRALTARIGARAPIARRLAMSMAGVAVFVLALPTIAHSWMPLHGETLTSAGQHPELQRGLSDIISSNEEYARKELQRPVAPGKIFPLPVMWLPIEMGASRYIVAIASTRFCLAGANNAGSGSEPSGCEVRVLDPSGKTVATGRACFVDTTDEDRPTANKHDRTEVDIVAAARELRFRSIVANKTWSQCSTTLKVP